MQLQKKVAMKPQPPQAPIKQLSPITTTCQQTDSDDAVHEKIFTETMATLIRTARGREVNLTISSSRDTDDASTSPHVNTLKDSKGPIHKPEGSKEVKAAAMVPSAIVNDSNSNGCSQHETHEHQELKVEPERECHGPPTETTTITASSSDTCDPNKGSSTPEQNEYLPTNLFVHSRIPSTASSIPHLMGKLSMSFLGIDAELPNSLDDSIASSREGGPSPSPYSQQLNSTPTEYQIALQQKQNPQHSFNFDDQQTPSSFASPNSGDQSRNYVKNYTTTPPHSLLGVVTNTPPYTTSQVPFNGQIQTPQRLSEQLQYQLSPEVVHAKSPCNKDDKEYSAEDIATESTPLIKVESFGLEAKTEPTSYHNNPLRSKRSVQPVLYSAINSLERYNEGSFDNKMLYAKVMRDKQSAFPGIPSKLNPETRGSTLESRYSSTSSQVNRKNRNRMDEADSQSTASGLSDSMQFQVEISAHREEKTNDNDCEQLVPTKTEPSLKKFIRSKSSSDLNESMIEDMVGAARRDGTDKRSVTIAEGTKPKKGKRREKKEKKVGVFRPSCDAYTPRMGDRPIKYKPAQERESVEKMSSTMGTIQRPNFRDALRRVAIILHQHIVKIEHRFETGIRGVDDTGLFKVSMRDEFSEDKFATPRYKCSMVRVPMARPGVVYSMRKIRVVYHTPSTDEIYEFAHQL